MFGGTREDDSGKNRNLPGSVTWEEQFALLQRYVEKLELREFLENANAIHVAGTKGKGSTCAFAESILLENEVKNVGLFTSPHLVDVRERFRIDGNRSGRRIYRGVLVDEKNDRKGVKNGAAGVFSIPVSLGLKDIQRRRPMSHIGSWIGREIGRDELRELRGCRGDEFRFRSRGSLGDTIGKIAWEKAGIFKGGVRVFTSPQVPEAMISLERKKTRLDASWSLRGRLI